MLTFKNRARRTLLWLWVLTASPVVLGAFSYYGWPVHEGESSYGEVVMQAMPPVSTRNGAPASLVTGRWILATWSRTPCDLQCLSRLDVVRHLIAAQGREAHRLVAVWLTDKPGSASAPDVAVYGIERNALAASLPIGVAPARDLLLIAMAFG